MRGLIILFQKGKTMLEIKNRKKGITITEFLFAACLFFAFLSERTLFGRVSFLLFSVAVLLGVCLRSLRVHFSWYFAIDFLFIIYCFAQNVLGISYSNSVSNQTILTYCLCMLFYFTVFWIFEFTHDFEKIVRIVFKTFFIAIIVNFFCDIDKIFLGRFNNNDGIEILGMKIGGIIAISLGWIAGACLFLNLYL